MGGASCCRSIPGQLAFFVQTALTLMAIIRTVGTQRSLHSLCTCFSFVLALTFSSLPRAVCGDWLRVTDTQGGNGFLDLESGLGPLTSLVLLYLPKPNRSESVYRCGHDKSRVSAGDTSSTTRMYLGM